MGTWVYVDDLFLTTDLVIFDLHLEINQENLITITCELIFNSDNIFMLYVLCALN